MRHRTAVLIETKEADGQMTQVPFNFNVIVRTGQWSAIRSIIVGYTEIS
jgi:hypothetical protein